MCRDDGWIKNSECSGGLQTYRCVQFGNERRDYEENCSDVMKTTTAIISISIIIFFGAIVMSILLLWPIFFKIQKWYGYLIFVHVLFGSFILVCGWIFFTSHKEECWTSIDKGARDGKNINGVIIISILYFGISAIHACIGSRVYNGERPSVDDLEEDSFLSKLFRRRRRLTTREHLLGGDRLIDEASSYEPPMTDTPILVAMATHDCEADNKDELSFKKGDQLELHEREGEWWVASLKGRKGLVPCNYIDQITDEL